MNEAFICVCVWIHMAAEQLVLAFMQISPSIQRTLCPATRSLICLPAPTTGPPNLQSFKANGIILRIVILSHNKKSPGMWDSLFKLSLQNPDRNLYVISPSRSHLIYLD